MLDSAAMCASAYPSNATLSDLSLLGSLTLLLLRR
jgi:hypothetical protein